MRHTAEAGHFFIEAFEKCITKRRCLMSRVIDQFELMPFDLVAEHCIDNGQQLAHAGGDDDLGFLASGFEALGDSAIAESLFGTLTNSFLLIRVYPWTTQF